MYVEGISKQLDDALTILAQPTKSASIEVIRAKSAAQELLPLYEAVLYPEDDDG